MSLITARLLGMALGAPLFSNLDLVVQKGDRIGLVAANGRGKSTLMGCLAGLVDPTEGAIQNARGVRIALMQQDLGAEDLAHSVRAALTDSLPAETRDWDAWRVDVALDALDFPADLRDRPLATLSGGWQRIALLARAALDEPDVLLLDEPTNHLDLERIGIVERWIAALPKETAVVVASHDRAFLDAVTWRTLFLRTTGSADFALPYSRARDSLDVEDQAAARRHEMDLREAAQLRRQAAKLNNIGVNSGSDLLTVKTRQLKARAERIETAAKPAFREESAGRIRLAERGATARTLLAIDTLTVTTPDGRKLFTTGRLWVQPGDRVMLLGANGSGKSQLMDRLAHALRGADVSGIRAGPSVITGHVDQALSHIDGGETLQSAIGSRFPLGEQRIRTLLAGAGFAVERLARPVATLSGGQRARLAMLILRLQQPNFYLLDEPTNHLDIEGQEALEGELTGGEAAAIIVSHDRRFVETVGNRFWRIQRGRLIEEDGPAEFFAEAMRG
ncbi:ATPase components of ABC transporters with duplicated ATPase domains [Kaistia soli DSM 19436]|uniref:ATPase components of ABC transporters with duplicated ATPase domains n=1 Tax=Kaistia soli DSM 19436 TaxID=1122133 RepID=A0A1M5CTS7_9HYPH|nr:ABC-F family ATP-binding cassette domain-containing protein [Kaistia soli]SHF58134.1 ATPase components of ABC transporters with duplicated ATPase domains [Kaistia soli DSM 19436]